MSDAIKIASQAPKLVEGMLADMFAAQADDNRVCMGSVQSGPRHIQIQLVVTNNPNALLDDDSGDDDDDTAEPNQPKSGLWIHWYGYRAEYIATRSKPRNFDDEIGLFLALGSIRAIYWEALSRGDTSLATEIGDWWDEFAPLHGLSPVII